MASKHRDIGLKFRHRSTPNTRRVTENVGFGGGVPYIIFCLSGRYQYGNIVSVSFQIICSKKRYRKTHSNL